MKRASSFLLLAAFALAALALSTAAAIRPASAARPTTSLPGETVVYDENNNGKADTDGDTWVFRDPTTKVAYLIVRYRVENERHVAYLYDDMKGDGRVDYTASGNHVTIDEPYWRLRVTARQAGAGWWLENGLPNWNVDVDAASAYKMAGTDADFYLVNAADPNAGTESGGGLDGEVWVTIQIWDTNQDGVPDIELDTDNLFGHGIHAIIVNENPHLNLTPDEHFPLLNTLIQLDREHARIQRLSHGTFIPFRTPEEGYSIYFNTRHPRKGTGPDQPRFPWEIFSFYNLRGDQSGLASASLRLVSDFAVPPVGYNEEARYSWSDRTSGADYRISAIGLHAFDQVTRYPFYAVVHVPWAKAVDWFASRAWQVGYFAEDEGGWYKNQIGEGIEPNGEWEAKVRALVLYRNRDTAIPPYLPDHLAVREEYSLSWDRKPLMYISPIDRRLHLVGAEKGIIVYAAQTVGNGRGLGYGGADFTREELAAGKVPTYSKVEYQDLDGDGYVDCWVWYRNDEPVAILYAATGHLVYADSTGIVVKTLPQGSDLPTVVGSPPSTPAQWATFHRTMAPYYDRERLDNLRGIFDAVPGESQWWPGARLTEVQPTPGGFSLVVQMEPSAAIPGWISSDKMPAVQADGQYLLRYDGQFHLSGLSPARLVVPPGGLHLSDFSPRQMDRVSIELRLSNTGSSPASKAEIRLLDRARGELTEIARRTITVPGQGDAILSFTWTPTSTGRHDIIAMEERSGAQRSLTTTSVMVRPRLLPSTADFLAMTTETPLGLLAAVAGTSVLISIVLFWRVSSNEGE